MTLTSTLRPVARTSSGNRFLIVQLLLWGTYAAIRYAASIPAILPAERPAMALATVVRAVTGMMLSSAMWPLVTTRLQSERRQPWMIIAAAAFAAGWAWTFLDRIALVTIASLTRVEIPWIRFVHGMDLDYFFVMLAWTAGAAGIVLADRARSQNEKILEQQLAAESARLQLLASQLNPHFLFNALNTIRSIAAEDSDRTREVVSRLAAFLRRVLSFDPSVPTRLDEELTLAADYLDVERARFESALSVDMSVSVEAAEAMVPPLTLQPLLENAVKHGTADADGIRRIAVNAGMKNGSLHVAVSNRGRLFRENGAGLGLDLTGNRLRHMYGDSARLTLDQVNESVVATIVIDHVRTGRTS
jgi:two-component system, LytTR family, sensor kinase